MSRHLTTPVAVALAAVLMALAFAASFALARSTGVVRCRDTA